MWKIYGNVYLHRQNSNEENGGNQLTHHCWKDKDRLQLLNTPPEKSDHKLPIQFLCPLSSDSWATLRRNNKKEIIQTHISFTREIESVPGMVKTDLLPSILPRQKLANWNNHSCQSGRENKKNGNARRWFEYGKYETGLTSTINYMLPIDCDILIDNLSRFESRIILQATTNS